MGDKREGEEREMMTYENIVSMFLLILLSSAHKYSFNGRPSS